MQHTSRHRATQERLPLKHAGGFKICHGTAAWPRLTRHQFKPIFKVARKVLLASKDPVILAQLEAASWEWAAFDSSVPFHHWPNLTPIQKSQALIAWILEQGQQPRTSKCASWRQKRFKPTDVLAAAIAGDLYTTYGQHTLRTPYARAVNIGRSVWFLLHPVYREFEQDNGHGLIRVKKVKLNRMVQIYSRTACQRIEQATTLEYGKEFLSKYGSQIAHQVMSSTYC